jgi:hypothetical protein
MTGTEDTAFAGIEKLYFSLDMNFSQLFAACTTDDQRNQLKRDYVNARDNYFEARGRLFAMNDPLVKNIAEDLSAAQASINHDLQNLQNAVQILKTIDTAVSLASRIIALGAL